MATPLDLGPARRLDADSIAAVSPTLARIAADGLIDAYDGPGGTFVVYASGSYVYVCTLSNDGPAMIEVDDLPDWSSDFAVPCARALAAGAIVPTGGKITETDADRAFDSHSAPPIVGLVQRRLLGIAWGATPDTLDPAVRISGYWNENKTELMLLLGREMWPFKRMDHHFTNGRLSSVHVDAWSRGDWSLMESYDAALRRHLPDARCYELESGEPWSAASSRARLEGHVRAEVKLRFSLEGATLLGSAIAYQKENAQLYRLFVVAFPP